MPCDWAPAKESTMSDIKRPSVRLPRSAEGTSREIKRGKSNKVSSSEIKLLKENSEEFVVKYDIKKLSSWFNSWQPWQQRLLVCTVMNCSTKRQLMMLATALEPLLHMDFCSILVPPFQSLHLDGVALFQNRRAITRNLLLPEIIQNVDSATYLNSLPSTFLSKKTAMLSKLPIEDLTTSTLGKTLSDIQSPIQRTCSPSSRSTNYLLKPQRETYRAVSKTATIAQRMPRKTRKKEPILPSLPLSHPVHLPSPAINREASFDQILGLRRQHFSSVPEFSSTVELMKKSGKRWVSGRKGERLIRRKTVGTYYTPIQSWRQKAEQFKEQLAKVTNVGTRR